MGKAQPLPILITGGSSPIGYDPSWQFINKEPHAIFRYPANHSTLMAVFKTAAHGCLV
ncbi:hypothetical protein KCA24_30305 [Escherichia coli]|nr:hypothetical protein [Escherichia coli]